MPKVLKHPSRRRERVVFGMTKRIEGAVASIKLARAVCANRETDRSYLFSGRPASGKNRGFRNNWRNRRL